tara:strand:+ start:790 stop:1386 length:597 start_codon:yes stop_codon:yes gene_type:complete
MREIPIFPTIIFGIDIPDKITSNVLDVIKTLNHTGEGNHPKTSSSDIHLRSDLKFYIDYLDNQFAEVKKKNNWMCDKLTITSMWSTKTQKGVSNYRHHHPMHWFSFIHYLTEGSATYFYDKDKETPPLMLGSSVGTEVCFRPGVNIPVGAMLLFPSWIPHSVEPHDGDYTRYSIAGNTFPEGNITPSTGVSLNLNIVQ